MRTEKVEKLVANLYDKKNTQNKYTHKRYTHKKFKTSIKSWIIIEVHRAIKFSQEHHTLI